MLKRPMRRPSGGGGPAVRGRRLSVRASMPTAVRSGMPCWRRCARM